MKPCHKQLNMTFICENLGIICILLQAVIYVILRAITRPMNEDTRFRNLSCPTDRTITVADQTYLFFGGTAYLGLSNQAEFRDLHITGIYRYGINNGTSRNNNVQLAVYTQAESYLAATYGVEEAILLSSGYLAAQLAIKHLSHLGKLCYAPAAHPSLWLHDNPGVQGDFSSWAHACVEEINNAPEEAFVIVSNSLDNMLPRDYDFGIFKAVNPRKKLYFLVDDSHGINVISAARFSLDITQFQHPNWALIVVSSLAKGMGIDAGAVFGSRALMQAMRAHPIFTGASPASPAAAYALQHAEGLYKQAHHSLQQNMKQMQAQLPPSCIYRPDFPVYTFKEVDLFNYLKEAGILISSFPYPLASDPLLNRVVVNGAHRATDIAYLQECLVTFFAERKKK